MNLLIGSRAIDYWHNVGISTNSDWDIISESPIVDVEFHPLTKLNNKDFVKYTDDKHTIELYGKTIHVVSLLGLAIIKRSHLWRDLSFDKHITQYHRHLSRYIDQASPEDLQILANRTELTRKEYPQFQVSLNKSVEEFFDDAVVKKFSHDWLHELFAYNTEPMYTKLQTDKNSAWCEYEKWCTMTEQEKLQCVAEECYVIAMERFVVPSDYKYIPKLAYLKALAKVCTTLTSGWFRDFAIDNYPKIIELWDKNKFEKVQDTLEKVC